MKIPLHKKIEQDILNKIQSGEYVDGETIFTELELAQAYGVSRPTVRQAIQSLVNDGYLERRQKRGTIVKRAKLKQEFTHSIESFDSEVYRKGMLPETRVLGFMTVAATPEVAQNLGISEGSPVYKLTRLRFAEHKPVVLVISFLPCHLLPDLENVDFTKCSLYSLLSEMGYPIQSASRRLEISVADELLGSLLEIPEGSPLFYFQTQGCTLNKVPIEYSIAKYRGDINYFVFELSK